MAEPGVPIHVDDVEAQEWEVGEIVARRKRLGAAAHAATLGVAIIEVPPGKRPNPPHCHADEEEIFLVLAGSGLSYHTSGSKDVRTYAIGVDDIVRYPAGGDAHTVVAGPEGLTVLIVAEGSRTNITWLPRTRQYLLGPRWLPADARHPFAEDAQLPPLELPEPTAQRPDTIVNLADLPFSEGRDGLLAHATRDARSDRLVMAHDAMPPVTHTTELHFHSMAEECWYVRGGSGIARRGTDAHELRPGSFWLERPDDGVGHRIEVGPDGMDLITMGDLVRGDACAYTEKGTVQVARGVVIPYTP